MKTLSIICMILILQTSGASTAAAETIDQKAAAQIAEREKAEAKKALEAGPVQQSVLSSMESAPVTRILSLVGGPLVGWTASLEATNGKTLLVRVGETIPGSWHVSGIDAGGVSLKRGAAVRRYKFGVRYGMTADAGGLPPLPALPGK